MTIQDFMLEAEKVINAYFKETGRENVNVKGIEVVKANDTLVHGLMLIPEGDIAGRSVYLDDLFDRHEDGEELNDLMSEMMHRCDSGLTAEGPPLHRAMDLDFSSIRRKLSVRLLGVRNNISYMAERPYIDVGNGLALIAVINCESSAVSEWVISVTNELLDAHIGCDKETLLTAALENTMEIEPPRLMDLEEHMYANLVRPTLIRDYLIDPLPEDRRCKAFMLTNRSAFQGAAVLFYPGVMERLADVFGCGYYVLPSSIHELIILPDVTEPDVGGLIDTVREANTNVISREDLLSWNVFYYDPDDGELRIAREKTYERTDAVREMGRTTA